MTRDGMFQVLIPEYQGPGCRCWALVPSQKATVGSESSQTSSNSNSSKQQQQQGGSAVAERMRNGRHAEQGRLDWPEWTRHACK